MDRQPLGGGERDHHHPERHAIEEMIGGTSPAPALSRTTAVEIMAALSAQIAACPEDIR